VSAVKERLTIEDFMEVADLPGKRELVDGEIIEMGAVKPRQGRVARRISTRLGQWAESTGRGEVYNETGFRVGENLRVPDVAYVSIERFVVEGEPDSFWPFAPDVAIEVISPSDDYEAVLTKTMEYLSAGTRQVWLLSPTAQNVSVYRSRTDVRVFEIGDEIDGGDVLPGFRCAVADFFAFPSRRM
jgi:Uma2 family endonuclease